MMDIGAPAGRIAIALTLLIATAACSKRDDRAADTAFGVNRPSMALRVSEVETGKRIEADKSIADETDDFGVRDTVYVAVKTEGSGTGTLAAKWTYQDGQTVDESSQRIAPTADMWHEFHVQKATAWPAGRYKVEITLDGTVAGSKEFEIR